MADFLPVYETMIVAEGGYKLANVSGDRGGQTYAGISRVMNPGWEGWAHIDRGEIPPSDLVRSFFRSGWWDPIQGDSIADQRVAATIFGFAENTSAHGRPTVAVKLVQLVVGATPDGQLGEKTLQALNAFNPDLFLARFALARVARRTAICNKDRGQVKFLLGWINRDLESVK